MTVCLFGHQSSLCIFYHRGKPDVSFLHLLAKQKSFGSFLSNNISLCAHSVSAVMIFSHATSFYKLRTWNEDEAVLQLVRAKHRQPPSVLVDPLEILIVIHLIVHSLIYSRVGKI